MIVASLFSLLSQKYTAGVHRGRSAQTFSQKHGLQLTGKSGSMKTGEFDQ